MNEHQRKNRENEFGFVKKSREKSDLCLRRDMFERRRRRRNIRKNRVRVMRYSARYRKIL